MHGRKKSAKPSTQEEKDAQTNKSRMYSMLCRAAFDKRRQALLNDESLELVTRILRINPDSYSLFNFVREILMFKHKSMFDAITPDNTRISSDIGHEVRDVQLQLVEDCILRSPKSYCAWYHRRWILSHFESDLEREYSLCEGLLLRDERNFHCWTYRRFLVQLSNSNSTTYSTAIIEREIRFSTEKLNQNFSNYSSYHHRTVFLSCLPDLSFPAEYNIVRNAIFTEPDDSSSWWYLIKYLLARINLARQDKENIVTDAKMLCDVDEGKWPLLLRLALSDNDEDRSEIREKLLVLDRIRFNLYKEYQFSIN